MGLHNSNYFTDLLQFVPIYNDNLYWRINMESFAVGDTVIARDSSVIFDSATVSIAGPKNYIQQIVTATNAIPTKFKNPPYGVYEDTYRVDCNSIPNLPLITINITSYISITLNSSQYIRQATPKDCRLRFQSIDFGGSWIFGMSFMQWVYTYFDFDNYQMGFAPAKP